MPGVRARHFQRGCADCRCARPQRPLVWRIYQAWAFASSLSVRERSAGVVLSVQAYVKFPERLDVASFRSTGAKMPADGAGRGPPECSR